MAKAWDKEEDFSLGQKAADYYAEKIAEIECEATKKQPGIVGIKHDEGKNRLDLIPPRALEEIGWALTHGSKKYGDFNYRNGMKWSRLVGASLRHLTAWCRGEDKDIESGLSHLGHLGACVVMLMDCAWHKLGEDDRIKG